MKTSCLRVVLIGGALALASVADSRSQEQAPIGGAPAVRPLTDDDARTLVTLEAEIQSAQNAHRNRAARAPLSAIVALYRETWGSNHPMTARALMAAGDNESWIDKVAARELYREAMAINERVLGPDHPVTEQSRVALVEMMLATEDYSQAEPLLRQSLDHTRRAQQSDAYFDALHRLYIALRATDRESEAHDFLIERVSAMRRAGRPHGMVALALIDVVENAVRFDDQIALESFREAKATIERSRDPLEVAPVLAQLATLAEQWLELPDEAETLGRRSVDLFHRVDASRFDRDAIYDVLNGRASSLMSQYRYAEAEVLFREVLSIWEQREGTSGDTLIFAAQNLASALEGQGKLHEALSFHRRALERIHASDFRRNSSVAVEANRLAARNLQLQREHAEAERFASTALEIARTRSSQTSLADTQVQLARILTDQGRHQEAEQLLRELFQAVSDSPWHVYRRRGRDLVANLRAQRRFAEAEVVIRELIHRAQSQTRPQRDVALFSDLAVILHDQGRDDEAVQTLEMAVSNSTDAERNRLAAIDNLLWLRVASGAPADAVRVAFIPYPPWNISADQQLLSPWGNWSNDLRPSLLSRALFAAAKARPESAETYRVVAFPFVQQEQRVEISRAFAAALAIRASENAGMGVVAIRWVSAQERADTLRQALTRARLLDSPDWSEINDHLAQIENEMYDDEAQLAQAYPRFFALFQDSPLSVLEARALLGENEAVVVLSNGSRLLPAASRNGLVYALTREGAAWAEIPLEPEELAAEIAVLHGQLATGGSTRAAQTGEAQATLGGARGFDRARAHRLYQALFGAPEIAALIEGKTRWTLAPQGVLLSAPFAALVTEAPEGGAAGDADPAMLRATHWLGLERTLSVTPSVSALRAQRRELPAAPMGSEVAFFGLGDPAFDGQPGPVRGQMRSFFRDRSANVEAVRALPRLPGTRAEIEQLARAFGARREDYVLDVVATESELNRRNADGSLARAEVIAFATHGLMAGDLSGSLAEPALALTPPVQATETDDSLLTASEAARLRLNARWVILSACNTASGGQPGAEGLTGLARGFFYAGARTLLVSQWPVNDEAAQLLTTRAVQLQRQENISAAEAMRRSMAELAANPAGDAHGRSFAYPSAWAPFILVSGE